MEIPIWFDYLVGKSIRGLRRVMRGSFTGGALVVVLSENNRVLGVKNHGRRYWGYPGGFLNRQEIWSVCAARELYEETGLDLPDLQFVEARRQQKNRHIDFIYVAWVDESTEIDPQKLELSNCEWLSIEQMSQRTNLDGRRILDLVLLHVEQRSGVIDMTKPAEHQTDPPDDIDLEGASIEGRDQHGR